MKSVNDIIPTLKETGFINYPTCEVGVAEGGLSIHLLREGAVKHYLVDNWGTIEGVTGDGNFNQSWHDKNYLNVIQKIEPYKDRAVVLRGLSAKMAEYVPDNSLGFIYIDAAHYYEGVMADLQAWYPKVIGGGIIAGHDYLNKAYGVYDAVNDFCKDRFRIHVLDEEHYYNAGFYFIKTSYAV